MGNRVPVVLVCWIELEIQSKQTEIVRGYWLHVTGGLLPRLVARPWHWLTNAHQQAEPLLRWSCVIASERSPLAGSASPQIGRTVLVLCCAVALILITFMCGSRFLVVSDRNPAGIALCPKQNWLAPVPEQSVLAKPWPSPGVQTKLSASVSFQFLSQLSSVLLVSFSAGSRLTSYHSSNPWEKELFL